MDNMRQLLNGDEAVAWAARDAGFHLGTGYPGTPSTEVLETFGALGGCAQWSPNEKVALEVALGAAFGNARALCTMKHVGLNVAADPLFTAAYTGVDGALVVLVADDPGMASSQNEQDSRRYAIAAGIPMLEPADSQQAYDFCLLAAVLSERWHLPVLLRLTTRVSHSKSIVQRQKPLPPAGPPHYVRDIPARVMVPGYARAAHRRLRAKLEEIRAWGETPGNGAIRHAASDADPAVGIVANGVSVMHAREALPRANVLQVALIHPAPVQAIAAFAAEADRTVIVEEGDPVLYEVCRTAGILVEGKAERYRFGELDVGRVRRLLAGDESPEPPPPSVMPPRLCPGCPHRKAFETLRDLGCTVTGDIGCYTLGVMPPFSSIDTTVCMGASITVGLGLRHVLPDTEARRVVSVIGDSTFVHSGLTGIAEMVYNPPPSGHVVLILDNGTTAMTGMQEHPGTGRRLDHSPTNSMKIEAVIAAMGVPHVVVIDHIREPERFIETLRQALASGELWTIIARRTCILAAHRIRQYALAPGSTTPEA